MEVEKIVGKSWMDVTFFDNSRTYAILSAQAPIYKNEPFLEKMETSVTFFKRNGDEVTKTFSDSNKAVEYFNKNNTFGVNLSKKEVNDLLDEAKLNHSTESAKTKRSI